MSFSCLLIIYSRGTLRRWTCRLMIEEKMPDSFWNYSFILFFAIDEVAVVRDSVVDIFSVMVMNHYQ